MTMPDDVRQRHDWPHGEALAVAAGAPEFTAFSLLAGRDNWDACWAALSGGADARLQAIKRFAGARFWSDTLAGEDQDTLNGAWSDFAGWTIDKALKAAWALPRNRKMLPKEIDAEAGVPGLFVLGLGKLGGRDLNYSSDVDLIAFFDAETLPVPASEGRAFITARVLRDMGKLLGTGGMDPVWRVDWRLRPDPSVTDISMSAEAGQQYFHFQSEPWRRLAMMKARVVAGDMTAGQAFLNDLKPFLWRKHLDFRMIDEIAGLKARIRNENPEIVAHSDESDDLDHADHMHLKLDRGGIREIEFIANALQLLWGGRKHELRITHTTTALRRLAAEGHLPGDTATMLIEAYLVFRRLENAVQAVRDAQDYRLPDKPEEQALVAALAGFADHRAVLAAVTPRRHAVHAAFNNLFAASRPSVADTAADEGDIPLDDEARAVVDQWRNGFSRHGVGEAVRANLRELPGMILALLADSRDPSAAVKAVEAFFLKLPPGGQYFSLMASQPAFLKDIIEPIITGSVAGRLLADNPHTADCLIERGGDLTSALVPDPEAAIARFAGERDYEARLEAFRALLNERKFLLNLALQRGQVSPDKAAEALTAFADAALAIGCRLVADEYFRDRFPEAAALPLSIIGMGKLGLKALTPGSDLDLVYVAREGIDLETGDRFARRLSTALGTRMRGGMVYEIDTRLRPSGNAGPPVLRLETLERHQMERANTWEHLALVPARMVLAPADVATVFEAMKARVIARPRDPVQLVRDAHKMLARLREHRIAKPKKGTLSVKLRPGGLMESEYLAAFLSLASGRNLYADPGAMPDDLRHALAFWRDVQMLARNLGVEDAALADPDGFAARLSLTGEALFSEAERHGEAVQALLRAHVIEPSGLKGKALETWEEGPVRAPD